MKNRESACTRETTRATLLVVDEPHTRGRVRFSLSLPLSQSFLSLLLLLLLLPLLLPADDDDARKGEYNGDAPGGRGIQRNASLKDRIRNRTDEHDNANERTTSLPSTATRRFSRSLSSPLRVFLSFARSLARSLQSI